MGYLSLSFFPFIDVKLFFAHQKNPKKTKKNRPSRKVKDLPHLSQNSKPNIKHIEEQFLIISPGL